MAKINYLSILFNTDTDAVVFLFCVACPVPAGSSQTFANFLPG